jgi:hypothetical protein
MDSTEHFVDDERVTCNTCSHASKVEGSEFVSLKKAKELKAQGKQVGMAGDVQTVAGAWLKLSWQEWQCQTLGVPAMPLDLPHHCHLHCNAKTAAVSVESPAWWQD